MHRMLFFLGKGGVGKSTISSTTSYQLARKGKKVLLVSLDPAHNLGDIFEMPLGDDPSRAAENLDVIEIDLPAWVRRYLKKSRDEIVSNYNYNLTINLDSYINILKYSPGTEEYATLWAIEHIWETWNEKYDYLVFDTPPTALTLHFLAMPAVTRLWVKELGSMREKILSKRQTLTRLNPDAAMLKGARHKEDDKVSIKLGLISSRLEMLYHLFTEHSYMSLVINDDRLSLAESKRICEELTKLKIGLHSICLNKVASAKERHEPVETAFADFPVYKVAAEEGGIHEPQQLAGIDIADLLEHIESQEHRT